MKTKLKKSVIVTEIKSSKTLPFLFSEFLDTMFSELEQSDKAFDTFSKDKSKIQELILNNHLGANLKPTLLKSNKAEPNKIKLKKTEFKILEPKTEEPKIEEPKIEEPKIEEPINITVNREDELRLKMLNFMK